MGIMVPITTSQGIQRAREDNRADRQWEIDQQFNEKRMQGLDMQMRRSQMELDEAEQNKPLRDLERKAKTTSEMAKRAYVMLESGHPEWGQIPDEQVAPFMAKFLTDTPVFGETKLMPNGMLSDGTREIPMDRRAALKMLAGLADPGKAMELAQREAAYINEQGKVETMTAGEAKGRGLEMASDKAATYGMNAAAIQDKYAEENAQLGLNVKRAQINSHNRANREKPVEMQFVSPDGKTVRTMAKEEGLRAGWTPYGDYKATADLRVPKLDRKAVRDEIDFIAKQLKETGSSQFNIVSDAVSLENMGSGEKQSIIDKVSSAIDDPNTSPRERQLAQRYVGLMQEGGYLDSQEYTDTVEAAKAEYQNLVRQFGRDRAREIIRQRQSGSGDIRNK